MRTLVKNNVANAFKLINDLKETVLLDRAGASSFDYTTGSVVETPTIARELKAVVTYKRKKDTNALLVEILVMTEEIESIADLDVFDKITVRGVQYNIVPPLIDDGYTVVINATRGVI